MDFVSRLDHVAVSSYMSVWREVELEKIRNPNSTGNNLPYFISYQCKIMKITVTSITCIYIHQRQEPCWWLYSARFSQKVVSGKKPPTLKNLAAHLDIVPLT